jgi:hypothetical protein
METGPLSGARLSDQLCGSIFLTGKEETESHPPPVPAFPVSTPGQKRRNLPLTEERAMATQEAGDVTGTKDKDYNIIWFTEQCLSNVLRLEQYAQDAERDGDSELAEFFKRAQGESRKGAEQGKALLASRIS